MATITYTVTVATGTTQYGTGNRYYINGELAPVLYLQEGNTYIFDQTDTSNATHTLAFSTNANNSPAAPYTTGVTTAGVPGNAGASTTINVAPVRTTGAPLLFYYCTAHSDMGNTAQTISPTSEETEFNPQIDEIIEEAYERTGVLGTRTGYQLRSARRSLNIMFQEWGNRGVHLWKVKLAKVPLVEGQAEYNYAADSVNFPQDISSILEAYYRNNSTTTNPQDIALTQISRSQYSQTPNKLTKGTPSQYYVARRLNPSIFLYATPSSSVSSTTTPTSFQFCFYYLSKIQDVGAYNNTSDVVNRFYPCMISGLAYYLSQKVSPERSGELERRYESEMLRALDADNQGTSSFISPSNILWEWCIMGGYASGKHAIAISDRSGLRFPYSEMVREWNGSLVHYSEYEAKQPQLEPKPVGSDPQALFNPRPQSAAVKSLILLEPNPFTSIIYSGTTYVNVYSEDHQRKAGDIVRFRGSPQVTSAGAGGADARNLQAFANIPTFDNVSDLNNANGFTIALGQIDSSGNVTGATTTDVLTDPINYFYITSTSNATTGNVQGGFNNCSAGPVTLEVVNG